MHGLIKERLEEYLRIVPETKLPAEFQDHLKCCEECRDELNVMREQASLLQVLRGEPDLEPNPGFYARVLERIEAQQKASIWNIFLEPAFGKKIVFASLSLLFALGGYLAFTEAGSTAGGPASADTIIAVQEHPPDLGTNQQRDRDTILVTLTTYRE